MDDEVFDFSIGINISSVLTIQKITNGAGKIPQINDLTNKYVVPKRSGLEEGHYQTTYSYSSRVVMALDQELKEWQVWVAFLERQLEIAHQENASLHRQLKEQKDVTQNTLPLQDEENKMSRKRIRGQGQNMNTEKKVRNCHHCGKGDHIEKDCWKKAGRCLSCGSTEHQIKDCPKVQTRGNSAGAGSSGQQNRTGSATRARVPARVYAIDKNDVEEDANVVEGTLSIPGIVAKVLTDPGSTRSSAKPGFLKNIGFKTETLS